MHRQHTLIRAVVTACTLLLCGRAPATAQECPEGTVSHVFVDNHDVFDTDELRDDAPFRWAYELANSLHVKTKAGFIEKELLFGVGDCYDPVILEESERLLRGYGFIARVDVFGLEQPDGTWHVVVDTKDEWTTKVDLGVAFDEGLRFRKIEITEENLLGQGRLVGLFYREREEERDLGGRFHTPRIFGTRLDAALEAGTTRGGTFFQQELFHPFVGEVGRLAFRQLFLHRDETFPYSRAEPGNGVYVLLPVSEQRFEISVAGRLGRPGNLTVFGLGISNETLDFPHFPSDVEVTRNGDFGDTEIAPADVTDRIVHQTLHSGGTRFNLLFGQRNIRFVQRRGLDALQGVQDVEMGTDVALTIGRSVEAFSAGDDQPDDLYGRLRVFGGLAGGGITANGALTVEGRQIFAGGDQGDGLDDVLAELDLLVYWQPEGASAHTFFGRLSGSGGWDMSHPFQLTLGGRDGLRGYRRERFPGAQRLLLTVEDRLYLPWPFPDLFDLGLTFFVDAGHMWAGNVPFGRTSGLEASAGAGLRIGFPAGTRGVVRVDAAVPVGSGGGFGDTILRISLFDVPGLAGGLEDMQLARSRRVTVGPDRFTRIR